MGVKHLSSWFMERVQKEAIKRIDRLGSVQTLAIDLNDTLHRAMNRAENCEKHFYRHVVALLKQLLARTRPQSNIGIFMDGVAPAAKLLLQIKRRRSSPPDSMQTAPLFSGLAITPGTPAMRNVASIIRETLYSVKQNIFFSCSDEPGEGEIKMAKWLKTLPKDQLGNVLIFGADADLIPISCMQKRLHSSRICLDMPNYQTVPVHALNQWIDDRQTSRQGRMEDLAILMMMLGNDYLPKLAGGFSPDLALKAYWLSGCAPLVHLDARACTASLDRNNLLRVFEYLHSELHPTVKKSSSQAVQNASESQPQNSCSVTDVTCFFTGIAWMASMYYSGECPDYRFRLPAKTSRISVTSCLEWLKGLKSDRIPPPISNEPPLDVEVAQLVLTPLWGRNMIQPHLQSAMDPDSELGYYFHHPCHICAGYRAVIRTFQHNIDHSSEAMEFRKNIALEHAAHMQEVHAPIWNSPPIEAIQSQLELIKRRKNWPIRLT